MCVTGVTVETPEAQEVARVALLCAHFGRLANAV